MANTKKIDFVILGLLSHEDLSGYEIKRRIDTTLKYFWGASYGSIYPALADLVKNGFAVKQVIESSERNKALYSITEEGHKHLSIWLEDPIEKDELRYETMLKIFFGNEIGALKTMKHVEAFEDKIAIELINLEKSKDILDSIQDIDDTHLYYLLTAEFGIKTYKSYLEWCILAKDKLRKRSLKDD